MRVNHEYDRGGALAYLAAYDVHRAKVFGRCDATTGIDAVHGPGRAGHDRKSPTPRPGGCSGSSTTAPPTAARPPSTGSTSPLPQRGHGPHPRPRLLAQPGGDLLLRRPAQSRLAQRLHRPRPGPRPARRLRAALQRHRPPFQWKFTTTDLDDLLARIDRAPAADRHKNLPPAA